VCFGWRLRAARRRPLRAGAGAGREAGGWGRARCAAVQRWRPARSRREQRRCEVLGAGPRARPDLAWVEGPARGTRARCVRRRGISKGAREDGGGGRQLGAGEGGWRGPGPGGAGGSGQRRRVCARGGAKRGGAGPNQGRGRGSTGHGIHGRLTPKKTHGLTMNLNSSKQGREGMKAWLQWGRRGARRGSVCQWAGAPPRRPPITFGAGPRRARPREGKGVQ
jgi:hypothetical protein